MTTADHDPSPVMVCVSDFERFAMATLPRNALDYYRSGADEQVTLKDNVDAFQRYKILPRVLVDVSQRDTRTTILGYPVSFPVGVSPTAMHCMAHPEGEAATARGAMSANTCFTLSTIATRSIEDIAAAAPDVLRFFQLYIYRDRDVTVQLIRRAERCGFKALVLTVDTPFFGKRRNDNRNKFKLPPHLKYRPHSQYLGNAKLHDYIIILSERMANFESIDFKGSGVSEAKKQSGLNEYASLLFDARITWKDIAWLKSVTSLPVVLKGILTASDAKKAVDCGVAGIIVSNHGARQLDTVPATIDVLSDVVQAVDGRLEVYLDGGVRTGTDVLKALALGAKAVFIGRPAIYALAYNGAEGVAQMLQILKDEFSVAMALAGCRNVNEISSDLIRRSAVLHEIVSKL